MSITAACDSGQSDSSMGDDDDSVLAPSAGKVLNVNCGPIHRRLWGPACVMISTCNAQYTINHYQHELLAEENNVTLFLESINSEIQSVELFKFCRQIYRQGRLWEYEERRKETPNQKNQWQHENTIVWQWCEMVDWRKIDSHNKYFYQQLHSQQTLSSA